MARLLLLSIFLVSFAFTYVCSQVVSSTACRKPDWCLDPCFKRKCNAVPTARCTPNYCWNRCEAIWWLPSKRVRCDAPPPPLPNPLQWDYKRCPVVEQGRFGSCRSECSQNMNDTTCPNRGQMCCFNGCSYTCQVPISVLSVVDFNDDEFYDGYDGKVRNFTMTIPPLPQVIIDSLLWRTEQTTVTAPTASSVPPIPTQPLINYLIPNFNFPYANANLNPNPNNPNYLNSNQNAANKP